MRKKINVIAYDKEIKNNDVNSNTDLFRKDSNKFDDVLTRLARKFRKLEDFVNNHEVEDLLFTEFEIIVSEYESVYNRAKCFQLDVSHYTREYNKLMEKYEKKCDSYVSIEKEKLRTKKENEEQKRRMKESCEIPMYKLTTYHCEKMFVSCGNASDY